MSLDHNNSFIELFDSLDAIFTGSFAIIHPHFPQKSMMVFDLIPSLRVIVIFLHTFKFAFLDLFFKQVSLVQKQVYLFKHGREGKSIVLFTTQVVKRREKFNSEVRVEDDQPFIFFTI